MSTIRMILIVTLMLVVAIVSGVGSLPAIYAADLNAWAVQGNVVEVETVQKVDDGTYLSILMAIVTSTEHGLDTVYVTCPIEAGILRTQCLSSVWFYCPVVYANSIDYDPDNGYVSISATSCRKGSYGRCGYAGGYVRRPSNGDHRPELVVEGLAQLSAASCTSK